MVENNPQVDPELMTSSRVYPKSELGSVFQENAKNLQARLDALYIRFGISDLRKIPEDPNFKLLSGQKGTREWVSLKFKTLQGMITEGVVGDQNALRAAERMVSDWENSKSVEVNQAA